MNPLLNEDPIPWLCIAGIFVLVYAIAEIVKCVKHNRKSKIAHKKIMQEFENRYGRMGNLK